MKISPLAFAAPVLLLLAACATRPPAAPPVAPASVSEERPPAHVDSAEQDQEAIYSAALGRAGLAVRVASNGCTKKADFQVQVLDGYPAPTVIFRRTRPDTCQSFAAGGADLLFSYAELGIRPGGSLVLANPITSDPTPGR